MQQSFGYSKNTHLLARHNIKLTIPMHQPNTRPPVLLIVAGRKKRVTSQGRWIFNG